MRRFAIWIGVLVALLTLLISIIHVTEGNQENPAKNVLGGERALKSQACWFGICPDHMTLPESVARLATYAHEHDGIFLDHPTIDEAGYAVPYVGCVTLQNPTRRVCTRPEFDNNSGIQINEQFSGADLRLGDVVAAIGNPGSAFMCLGVPREMLPDNATEGLFVQLSYTNGLIISAIAPIYVDTYYFPMTPLPPSIWRVSPLMRVTQIDYRVMTEYSGKRESETDFLWHRFGEGIPIQNGCGP